MTQRHDTTSAEAASVEAKEPYTQTKENDSEELGRREDDEDHEIFKSRTDGVQFRTVGWPMASIIFLKREFFTFTPYPIQNPTGKPARNMKKQRS